MTTEKNAIGKVLLMAAKKSDIIHWGELVRRVGRSDRVVRDVINGKATSQPVVEKLIELCGDDVTSVIQGVSA